MRNCINNLIVSKGAPSAEPDAALMLREQRQRHRPLLCRCTRPAADHEHRGRLEEILCNRRPGVPTFHPTTTVGAKTDELLWRQSTKCECGYSQLARIAAWYRSPASTLIHDIHRLAGSGQDDGLAQGQILVQLER